MISKGLDEDRVEDPFPRWHGRQLGAVGVDGVPVELAAADVDVDVASAQPGLALPCKADEPEEYDDGEGEVRLEEALGIVEAALGRADGDVELLCSRGSDGCLRVKERRERAQPAIGWVTYLSNQYEHNQRKAKIAAVDASDGLEWDFFDCVAVEGPSTAESDVREADAAPSEERGQARQG